MKQTPIVMSVEFLDLNEDFSYKNEMVTEEQRIHKVEVEPSALYLFLKKVSCFVKPIISRSRYSPVGRDTPKPTLSKSRSIPMIARYTRVKKQN